MKLYLAVAVLLLALASVAEAQEDTSISDRFTEFGQDVTRIGSDLAEKAKTTFTNIQESEFVRDSGNWFAKQFEKVKETFGN